MTVREIPGVQRPVVRFARSRGWLAWKMKIEGINGHPDYNFYKDGKVIFMEFKAKDGQLSTQQRLRIKDLLDHGMEVYVIEDPAVGIAVLENAFKSVKL